MKYIAVVGVFACANDLFYLIADFKIQGMFNIRDVGNGMIIIALCFFIFRNKYVEKKISNKGVFIYENFDGNRKVNAITILILIYLFMVLINIFTAVFNYGQSIVDSMITARHQFYYLSYFLFLLAIRTKKEIETLMQVMTVLAILLIGVSIVNYLGVPMFHHPKWSDGSGMRSGVIRAFVPGMDIICMAFMWQFSCLVNRYGFTYRPAVNASILFGGLLFRQTRARIIAASFSALVMLLRQRKRKFHFLLFSILVVGVITVACFGHENPVMNLYRSAYTDLTKAEGTWSVRKRLIEENLTIFMEHPVLGSGAFLIRIQNERQASKVLIADSNTADLGYMHWLKNYGIVGIIWMVLVAVMFVKNFRVVLNDENEKIIAQFSAYQFLNIMISMITLGYLFRVNGILVFSLTLALSARIPAIAGQDALNENN